jgi:thioredoxin reductase (NADPH)
MENFKESPVSEIVSKPPPRNRVLVYGRPDSPEAYAIRDLLSRSGVVFDWIELAGDDDGRRALGLSTLDHVQLLDGVQLFAPTVREVAERLGWMTQPRLREYDLSIYGAGPAGLSAAVYGASEGLRTVLIEREVVGGQAGTSSLIENFLGFAEKISGAELAERAREQAMIFGAEVLLLREGIKAEFRQNRIHVDLADGRGMVARANICATGVEYRRLELANENQLLNAGVYYGAGASEASMCRDEHVIVVGGGNSAASLSTYLLVRVTQTTNVEILYHAQVTELKGETVLSEVEISDMRDGSKRLIPTRRLFVCIGGVPNTEWAKDTAIVRDEAGYLVTGPDLLRQGRTPECWPLARTPFFLETSVPGSFAAGDVRHGSVKRVASAVGDGAMAVTFVHRYLEETGLNG